MAAIRHAKVSTRNPTADTTAVQPVDWNAAHTLDPGTVGTADLADGSITAAKLVDGSVTAAKLAPTGVTPGVYTSLNATITADGRVTLAANGTGGGGGGITNSAGASVLMKSDGTNAVASGLSDDGSVVAMTARKFQVGTGAVPTNNKAFFSLCDATTTTQLYIQELDTNHVGVVGVNNEAINLVCDQKATFDTTSVPGGASANCVTALCSSSRVAGAGLLTNAAIIAQAVNGDINYCFLGVPGGGKIRCDDGVTAGPIDCTNLTTSSTVTIVGTTGSSLNLTGTASISGTCSLGGVTSSGGGLTLGTAGSLKAVNYIEFNSAGAEVDIYHTFANTGAAGNKAININSAGTSPVRINSNADGIAHSGTGGLEVYAGNNGSTVVGAITAGGMTWGQSLAAKTESLTSSGAASIALGNTFVSGAASNLTLANGTIDGQIKTVIATSGTGQVTPTNFGNGTKMTWGSTGQSCTMVWGSASGKWWLTANVGMTVV